MQMDYNQEAPSLISRDESTAVKGLLMLLVAFGHTSLLTTDYSDGDKTFLWYWLYSFHVYLFFILPFIYGYKRRTGTTKEINKKCGIVDIGAVTLDIKHSLIKIGVPYFWFFLLSAIVFVISRGGKCDITGMLYAFLFGNEPLIDKYIGFNYMWFLPSMLSLLILKSVYYNSCKSLKFVIIVISAFLWSLTLLRFITIYSVGMYIPFAITHAFFYIIWGLCVRYIIEKGWSSKYQTPVILLLVIILSILLFFRNDIKSFLSVNMTIRLIFPIVMFMLLYTIRYFLAKSKVLIFIGTYSLQIYLIHVYIINALTLYSLHFLGRSIFIGVVIYITAITISCCLSKIMCNIPFVNKYVFPKE